MLDLLHIHPSPSLHFPGFLYLPAGIFGLLNEVRSTGYDVLALDEPLELQLNPTFSVASTLTRMPARVYSIDMHWHEHLCGGIRVAQCIKSIFPQSIVVVGGLSASLFAAELLDSVPEIDIVVSGYGERMLPALLRGDTLGRRGILQGTATPDLTSEDLRSFDVLLHADEYLYCSIHEFNSRRHNSVFWLKNGHGCLQSCSYCGGAVTAQQEIFGHKRIYRRPAEIVARDIEALAKRVETVALTLDTSSAPEAYWKKLHHAIRASSPVCGLYIEPTGLPSDDFIDDFARTFAKNKSMIALSPLCGDEVLRRRNGKMFANNQFFSCIGRMEHAGIRYCLYFTSGLPFSGESDSRLERSFREELRRRYNPLFVFDATVTLDPGSPMSRNPEYFGIETTLHTCSDYVSRWDGVPPGRAADRLGYSLSKECSSQMAGISL
jgi:radical SAM superfamily enzyme YgiQ (UPF0313 family)